MEKLKNIPKIEFLIIASAAFVAVFSLVFFGMPFEIKFAGSDLMHHIQITTAYIDSFRQGILFPDWTSGENLGYGGVVVRFYPPLAHISLAVFYLITGGSWQWAFILCFFVWSLVGGCGAYLWADDVLKNRFQSHIAAVLFVLAPYHLKQIHLSFMFGEFVAMSALPFCFLFAQRICKGGKMRDVAGFAVAFAVLILSNLPQLVIIALCVGVYILFFLEREKLFGQIGKLAFASVSALAGTAFYWWRMVFERQWLNIYQPNLDPDYDFRNNFLLTVFDFDTRGIWLITLIFALTMIYFLLSSIVTGKIKNIFKETELRRLLIVFVFALFLSLPFSKFIWTNVEFLQRIQFPWRFLTVMTAIVCILIAYCFSFINRENLLRKRPLILLLVGFSLMFLTFSIKHISWGGQNVAPAEFAQYADNYRQEKGLWHWLPVWTRGGGTDENEKVIAGKRAFEIKSWDAKRREFTFAEGEPEQARIAVFYYPHWQIFINGERRETRPSDDGALMFDVPPEKSEVVAEFVEPFGTFVSRYISMAAWIFIIGLLIFSWRKR